MSPSQNCAPRPRRFASPKTISVSELGVASEAAPRGLKLHQRLRLDADLEPKSPDRLVQKATGPGMMMLRQFRCRVHEHIDMGVEVQRPQGFASTRRVLLCATRVLAPKPIRPRTG